MGEMDRLAVGRKDAMDEVSNRDAGTDRFGVPVSSSRGQCLWQYKQTIIWRSISTV
jgi:hypothetical protein